MFSRILIANRGEIAVRIARTARRLGIAVVAVYSAADRQAPHVRLADKAVAIGAAPAADSYLNIDRIVRAAKATGAEAVHPGYGFLSENADFCTALEANGIAFIGPTADTLRRLGAKSAAKDLMRDAGVPVLPGYQGECQSPATLTAAAERIGYPVLLKAVAGGGGRGLRLVANPAELDGALASAQREAAAAFGDPRCLVEKYLERPRHVEVQIFGDGRGKVVHVFERDCSVQRRHQKIVEEAPAPELDPVIRRELLAAGVRAGAAVDYRGAGTVEFLYDGAAGVYFMEMNTRLQVEHPVSEAISGLDFVEWQLRIAAGEGLPREQADIAERGHAFEARLYAEDPNRDFAPSTGTIRHLELPALARVDSGVENGQIVTPYYDPMLAKIVTHGEDRSEALGRLQLALADTRVSGLETNTAFLLALCREPAFAAGDLSTRFIEEHREALFADGRAPRPATLAAAALWQAGAAADDGDPWTALSGWRLNDRRVTTLALRDGETTTVLTLRRRAAAFELLVEPAAAAADRRRATDPAAGFRLRGEVAGRTDAALDFTLDEASMRAHIAAHGNGLRIWIDGEAGPADLTIVEPAASAAEPGSAEGSLAAPMPGVVVEVLVAAGECVRAGDTLLVLEAMKMEHQVRAPAAGVVRRVLGRAGAPVSEGDPMIELKEHWPTQEKHSLPGG